MAYGLTITGNDFKTGTQNQRIKDAIAFLKSVGGGTLELGVDTVSTPNTSTWVISESILMPSNTTLYLNNSKLKMADGVFDTMIRNDGIVVDGANPNSYATALNENRKIRIIGSGVGKSFIEGADVAYSAPHPFNGGASVPWTGDWYGWRGVTILFANVKIYEIAGISFSKTKSWVISQEHGCRGMNLHDLDFQTTVKNGDGINFRKGCKNGKVKNITGSTSDDLIACTALVMSLTLPSATYVYPIQVGGLGTSILGDTIEDITIDNVTGSSSTNLLICLAAGGGKVKNIRGNHFTENGSTTGLNIVKIYTGYATPVASLGDISNIGINNVSAKNTTPAVYVDTPLKDSNINLVSSKTGGVAYSVSGTYSGNQSNVVTSNLITN